MTEVAEIQDEPQAVPAEVNELRWRNLRKRKGCFSIAAEMLENNCDAVLVIMRDCFVTKCEHRWDTDVFEYRALSWQFRELGEGQRAPVYVWEKDDTGTWNAREIEGTQ